MLRTRCKCQPSTCIVPQVPPLSYSDVAMLENRPCKQPGISQMKKRNAPLSSLFQRIRKVAWCLQLDKKVTCQYSVSVIISVRRKEHCSVIVHSEASLE
ncbi:hypothetical protein CDEST_13681 [Colletotrichum destructivum]|uniref:Uncharacterized protein n=1 Tax=Colletotrichum destructivum TaxID=34406 RepID=A0AAX4IZV5_9PEZI|nr:hypothetical protein CDEST_13681 [Colletotrichum destructivum]